MSVMRALAIDTSSGASGGSVPKTIDPGNIPTVSGGDLVQDVLNIVYFIVGIVAVGMIIYAGIQYLTANGEPGKAKKAMDTIIFSVVGLIVVIAAFAITNFVINQLG